MKISSSQPMSYNDLQCSLTLEETGAENLLLQWVSTQESSFIEDKFSFAGKTIHRFQGSTESGPLKLYSFGRSQDRGLAAVKAAAELLERLVFIDFTKNQVPLNLGLIVENGSWSLEKSEAATTIERSFFNSNGWAVGSTAKDAINRALRESLERHILLFSFLKDGWSGFYQINETKISDISLRSLISKYSVAGFSAGLGICQAPQFPGASFGYLCDHQDQILTSSRWEQVFYESYDYLRMKMANPLTSHQGDLIGRELEYFLSTPFEVEFNNTPEYKEITSKISTKLAVMDLKEHLGLPFSFYAAVVHGGDLLPLFFKSTLSSSAERGLKATLLSLGVFSEIPERHPIL